MTAQARCSFSRTWMHNLRCRQPSLRLSDAEYDAFRRAADSHQFVVEAYAARAAVAHAQSPAGADVARPTRTKRHCRLERIVAAGRVSQVVAQTPLSSTACPVPSRGYRPCDR